MCVDFSSMFMFLSNHRATSVVVFSHCVLLESHCRMSVFCCFRRILYVNREAVLA